MVKSYKFYKEKRVRGEIIKIPRNTKLLSSIKLEGDGYISYSLQVKGRQHDLMVVLELNNFVKINKKTLNPFQTKKLLCNRYHKNKTQISNYYLTKPLRAELQ